jgi:hypothetical protein
MYGGMCTGHYAQSMLQLQNTMQRNRIDMAVSFVFNESLITRGRNAIVHNFLKSGFTHLMFIDADIKFNAEDIIPMLLSEKEIICGIYPKKEINWALVEQAVKAGVPTDQIKYYSGTHVVNLLDGAAQQKFVVTEPAKIANGGTGFMIIKREVFDKMAPHVGRYINNAVDLSGNIGAEEIVEFFTTSIDPDTQHLLSEDYHFCRVWRELGGDIWTAPWVQLGHMGSYLFDGAMSPELPEDE